MTDKSAAFRPLTDDEKAASTEQAKVHQMPKPEPVCPVPYDAPEMKFRHPKYGEPIAVWRYVHGEASDTQGTPRLMFYTARFEQPDGRKVILPIAYCKLPSGGMGWRSRWPKPPRPLYRLPELRGRKNAPVLVVEGEKKCVPAERLFTDYVATAPSAGSNRAAETDWSPVKGRQVTIWPDADSDKVREDGSTAEAPGRKFARTVAQLCMEAGASSVRIVQIPDEWCKGETEGWDLADDPATLPGNVTKEVLRELLDNAERWKPAQEPQYVSFGQFKSGPQGIKYDPGEDEDLIALCGPLEVLAQTRSADGDNWGLYVRWQDDDGNAHEWAMPRSLLAGDGSQMRAAFLSGGLFVAPGRKPREFLSSYLSTVKVKARARAVTRCGWHGNSFVLPNEVIGGQGGEQIILQTDSPPDHAIKTSGTLSEWREHISRPAVGNSRLVLSISTGFTPPLMHHASAESGGVHFIGPSSIGKTTALRCGGSVWGGNGDDPQGYSRTWRATANGLEGILAAHSDCLLCLDEMGQVSGREAGDVCYMIGNGTGKIRASRNGMARKAHVWRVFVLSTGEVGLAEKMREDGRKIGARPGQMVRLIEIPADAKAGHGMFENLHGYPGGQQLADALRSASQKYYGTAAREFIGRLITAGVGDLMGAFGAFKQEFEIEVCPPRSDGQVQRVAARFALIGFAGELATSMGITGWPQGEARQAAVKCFHAWLENRGGAGDAETMQGLAQVRAFLDAHGSSRFPFTDDDGVASTGPVRDRAGYRRRTDDGIEYCIFPSVWKNEVTRGFDGNALLDVLRSQKHLRCDADRRTAKVRTPDGNKNFYCLKPSFHVDEGRDE